MCYGKMELLTISVRGTWNPFLRFTATLIPILSVIRKLIPRLVLEVILKMVKNLVLEVILKMVKNLVLEVILKMVKNLVREN